MSISLTNNGLGGNIYMSNVDAVNSIQMYTPPTPTPTLISYTGVAGSTSLSPGTYTFTIVGGGGGNNPENVGGSGRQLVVQYTILSPITINYVVAGAGGFQTNNTQGTVSGGGGATYVYDVTNSQWLFVAGGGGGLAVFYGTGGVNGDDALDSSNPGDGSGGTAVSMSGGGGGGGVSGNGAGTYFPSFPNGGGKSYVNGSAGGVADGTSNGGFGGGGSGYYVSYAAGNHGAGGGGYSGGTSGGYLHPGGFGGTSYVISGATVISDVPASNPGQNGYISYV